ncbi:MAG: oxygen-independent coproporphyrinogen III oxidase [Propionibacteriaceae bacterium]|nr:oxygen-independent coproporphyrinogen III oxidase [Propionibacteriaceae bacterium]
MKLDLNLNGDIVPLTSELLEQYDVAGPRYTSYPTAPQWSDDFGPADWDQALTASNQPEDGSARPLSLYMHLPFCRQMCLFCGCNTVVQSHPERAEPYLETLKQDIAAVASRLDSSRPVIQFHWGGGTPTYFRPELLADLFTFTQQHFQFAPDAEIGVELDPRVTTIDHLTTLKQLGFNRLSLGVQDFDPTVQAAVKRIQPYELVRDLMAACRDLGFESLNTDLIYGLPHQTNDSFHTTVEQLLTLSPDRIALFSYGHVPWVKRQQRVLNDIIPLGLDKFQLFRQSLNTFVEAGYVSIGFDHFSRPQDELYQAFRDGTLHRNFQGYTTKAGADLIGFGATAISSLARTYAQNQRSLPDYRTAIESATLPVIRGYALSRDDVIRGEVINRLMSLGRVDKAAASAATGIDFDDYFAAELASLEPLVADGLVELTPDQVKVTGLGQLFARNVAMHFDAYLDPSSTDGPRYSRTI